QPHSPCAQLSRAPNRSKRCCNSSTRFWCGAISALTASPLRVKWTVRISLLQRHALRGAQRPKDGLGSDRQRREPTADLVLVCVRNRGRHRNRATLTYSLGAERTGALFGLDRLVDDQWRDVEQARNLVVGERGVGHLPGIEFHLLLHGEAELHHR